MRSWQLHVFFATILVGSLIAKERAVETLEIDNVTLRSAVTRVAQSQGLDFRGDTLINGTSVPALTFEAPSCSGPVLVALRIVFEQEIVMRFAREKGDILRYIYIDRAWETPDRLALFVERIKYAATAALGLTLYVPSGHLLLVDSPPRCQMAEAIDWRNVWNRDYLASVRGGIEP